MEGRCVADNRIERERADNRIDRERATQRVRESEKKRALSYPAG